MSKYSISYCKILGIWTDFQVQGFLFNVLRSSSSCHILICYHTPITSATSLHYCFACFSALNSTRGYHLPPPPFFTSCHSVIVIILYTHLSHLPFLLAKMTPFHNSCHANFSVSKLKLLKVHWGNHCEYAYVKGVTMVEQ